MRLFFAYWPSAKKAAELATWVHKAHALYGGRMMHADTLHMTLAFLGPADPGRVQTLLEACGDWRLPSGAMVLHEPGRFGKPKVLWLGPSSGDPAALDWLFQANEQLWARLAPLGWQPREPVFRPHVSLLRNAGPGDLAALQGPPVIWAPERCVLVASEPAATGSRYTVLAELPLTPSPSAAGVTEPPLGRV